MQQRSRAEQTQPPPVCLPKHTKHTHHFIFKKSKMSRLTGPLLFREMFFHSRRCSWCRNPIFLPPTSASVCTKCFCFFLPNEHTGGGGLWLGLNYREISIPLPGLTVPTLSRCFSVSPRMKQFLLSAGSKRRDGSVCVCVRELCVGRPPNRVGTGKKR